MTTTTHGGRGPYPSTAADRAPTASAGTGRAGLTTARLAELVGGELVGPGDVVIDSFEQMRDADRGTLTFIGDRSYAELWERCPASAAVVTRGIELSPGPGRALIFVDDADLAIARVLEYVAPEPVQPPLGVHPTTVVDPTAQLGRQVRIGPHCMIGPGVKIGDRCVLHNAVTLHGPASIGDDNVLWTGVVIREGTRLGHRCIIHPNVTIGADGFGYRRTEGASGPYLVKIPHLGGVSIGNDVELGAGTCVDRGKFADTTIGDGTKIDNLVQVAHNCRIGRRVVIAGSSGLAGSVTIGDDVMIGGMVAVKDHVTVGAGAKLGGASHVSKNVPAGAWWSGSPAHEHYEVRREYAAVRHLPSIITRLRKLVSKDE